MNQIWQSIFMEIFWPFLKKISKFCPNCYVVTLNFRDVSGLLASIVEKDDQYGKKFNFEIIDGEETIIVQLWKESSYADTMISKLPNIDLTQPIKLIPHSPPKTAQEAKNKALR